ncbi:MAG: S8 family serine peptidase [Deltaproteobacteria bacterium]|nr:S8 family serine peptidase [Deltaproteobacteria bacterium]
MLEVAIEGKPAPELGISSVDITASRVDVVHSDTPTGSEKVITVAQGTFTTRIVAVAAALPLQAGLFSVPPGYVHQIRFITESIKVIKDGADYDVKLPSGPQTGLKIIPADETQPFPVKADTITVVKAVFDPEVQVTFNEHRTNEYIVKPVLVGELASEDIFIPPQFVPGQVYALFAEDTDQATVDSINAEIGATVARRSARHPWYTVQLPSGSDENAAVAFYRAKPQVRWAMRNYNAHSLNRLPADFSGPGDTTQYWLFQTESPAAWDTTVGDSRVVLAVVDHGANLAHEELQENVFFNVGEIPHEVRFTEDCRPRDPPIDISTLVLDADGDGATTLRDFNIEPNRSLLLGILGRSDFVRLDDLINEGCGLFEDTEDNDSNGHTDDLVGWDFVGDDNWPYPDQIPITCNTMAHGGAVAGIAGATEDGESIFAAAGLRAPNYVGQAWRVRILVTRAFAPETQMMPYDRVHDALDYSIGLGASVINASWSELCAPQNDSVPEKYRCSDADRADKAESMRRTFEIANIGQALLVVGGVNYAVDLGKDGVQDLPTELGLDTQISVTSVRQDDSFPADLRISWGAGAYQMAAAGIDMSVLSAKRINLSSLPGDRCLGLETHDPEGVEPALESGSSLAAPQVAGVAVLVIATDFDRLAHDPAAIKQRILRGGNCDLPSLDGRVERGRRLNARGAVEDLDLC